MLIAEKVRKYQTEPHGEVKSGLILTPATPLNELLTLGLSNLFVEGIANGTIVPGSPKVNGESVSVTEWLEYLTTSDTNSIVHAIEVQMDYGLPFKSVGHVTATVPTSESEPVETRIYIHDEINRGLGIGECALRTQVRALQANGLENLVAFVHPTNIGSLRIHNAVYRFPKTGYPGKEYMMRAYSLPLR